MIPSRNILCPPGPGSCMPYTMYNMSHTVNTVDSRAILRMDIGFYIRVILRPLLIMSFWFANNIAICSYFVSIMD